jgi:hypothetical protein
VEASQDVELTGTNRPCGLTANLKPIQVGLRGDDSYRDRRRTVVRIEDCQSVRSSGFTKRCSQIPTYSVSRKFRPSTFQDGKLSGRHSEGVTPVPIPNTAVKPLSADGTVPDGGTGE